MLEFYPQTIYYPREVVEQKYTNGELCHTEGYLLDFADRHRDDIWALAYDDSAVPSDSDLIDATKLLILSRGSVQPAAEMGDIIREINKEIWYRGEKTHSPQNAAEVSADWQEKYASKWREARLFETLVVLDHCAARVLDRLHGGA
jgi:hypothetical protein